MTDKVQKIREEVVRMHNLLPVMDSGNISVNYADRICATLEMYIDTLQKEPVSEKKCMFTKDIYTDEDRKVLCEDCKEKCEYSKKEEPVSQDLKEAANEYGLNIRKGYPRVMDKTDKFIYDAFKAGSHWQKDKFVAWLTRESDFLIQELKKGNKAYGLPEQYRVQLYKEIVNKLKD